MPSARRNKPASSSTTSVPTPAAESTASSASPPKKSRVLRRKTDHSVIERRRREKINEKLVQLQSVVPACRRECQDLFERRFDGATATAAESSKRQTSTDKLAKAKEDMQHKIRTSMVLEKLCIISHTVDYVLELRAELEQLKGRCRSEHGATSPGTSPADTERLLGKSMADHYQEAHPPSQTQACVGEAEVSKRRVARGRSASTSTASSSTPTTPPQSPRHACTPSISKIVELPGGGRLQDDRTLSAPSCSHVAKKVRLHWGSDRVRSSAVKNARCRGSDHGFDEPAAATAKSSAAIERRRRRRRRRLLPLDYDAGPSGGRVHDGPLDAGAEAEARR
ncbi:uncharacterized protein PFL1_00615 [Pseudozyma flocculosa PF-1]|uniref:uncharacterized protein n=1 Tax=Pseudozyma flocculosa PF-1 TaxID=1277687 RepID=UPI0004560BDF|nr:uncharacterized protein PFL1_00615 [Pseudozyma flocculosa PF-1]EPQ32419.1 hypothetical protein PFL1_00615 [Pseudozyma flocculosa PF-1]